MKRTKLFKSGGSYAVRIPREWVPPTGRVILRREADRIVISEDRTDDLRELAARFAQDGLLDFTRPEQPPAAPAKEL